MKYKRVAAILAIVGALAAPVTAQAHISLHPNTIPAGAFVTLDVRVPGEQAGAYAYKLDMLIPPGFTEIDTQDVPGWSVRKIMTRLARPIQTDEGPVDEEVSRIVWTGDRTRLGRVEDGQFIQFPLSIAMPASAAAGRSLAFKTLQYYSNGKVVRWIGVPSAEYPAPRIDVTPKGGPIEDVAGDEAGPTPGTPGAPPSGRSGASSTPGPGAGKSNGGASEGLAIAALILGAVGLLVGTGALVTARGRRRAVGS